MVIGYDGHMYGCSQHGLGHETICRKQGVCFREESRVKEMKELEA